MHIDSAYVVAGAVLAATAVIPSQGLALLLFVASVIAALLLRIRRLQAELEAARAPSAPAAIAPPAKNDPLPPGPLRVSGGNTCDGTRHMLDEIYGFLVDVRCHCSNTLPLAVGFS